MSDSKNAQKESDNKQGDLVRCDQCNDYLMDWKVLFVDENNELLHAFCFECFQNVVDPNLIQSAPTETLKH